MILSKLGNLPLRHITLFGHKPVKQGQNLFSCDVIVLKDHLMMGNPKMKSVF